MRGIVAAMAVVIGAALAGCESLEPDYRVSSVEFDESLLGTWEVMGNKSGETPLRVIVTAREVDVAEERLNPPPLPEEKPRSRGSARVYSARLPSVDEPGLEFGAYLVRVGADRYIGFQETGINGRYRGPFLLPLSVPTHWFVRLRMETDELAEVDLPRNWVGWVPLVRWLDEREEDPGKAPGPARESMTVSSSIDQVLAYYSAHAQDEGFWQETPLRCRRIAGPAPEAGSPGGAERSGVEK